MGTRTIRIDEEVYERLKARKREDETISDVVARLIDESTADWREGFGTLSSGEAADLEATAERSREAVGTGLAAHDDTGSGTLQDDDSDDHTA